MYYERTVYACTDESRRGIRRGYVTRDRRIGNGFRRIRSYHRWWYRAIMDTGNDSPSPVLSYVDTAHGVHVPQGSIRRGRVRGKSHMARMPIYMGILSGTSLWKGGRGMTGEINRGYCALLECILSSLSLGTEATLRKNV